MFSPHLKILQGSIWTRRNVHKIYRGYLQSISPLFFLYIPSFSLDTSNRFLRVHDLVPTCYKFEVTINKLPRGLYIASNPYCLKSHETDRISSGQPTFSEHFVTLTIQPFIDILLKPSVENC